LHSTNGRHNGLQTIVESFQGYEILAIIGKLKVGKRIHIIDDDRFMLNLLQASLGRRGFDVTCTFDSRHIFDLADDLPDLFLIDVVLPGLNGLETCKWIKTQNSNLPVIILSATPCLGVLSKQVAADDYLEKPFKLSILLEKINRCLDAATASTIAD
jgi:DNA-binding response OmpR family regulator